MQRLLVKTYESGKKYLCKSERENFWDYRGSGMDIPKTDSVIDTEVLFETNCSNEFKEVGIYYSEMWSVDTNTLFYNRCFEEGQGGNTGAEGEAKRQKKRALKSERPAVKLIYKYKKRFSRPGSVNNTWKSFCTTGVNWSQWSDEKLDEVLEMLFEKYGSPDTIDWKADGRGKSSSNGKAISEALLRYNAKRRAKSF